MLFSCYNIVDLSIAAAAEKHPAWILNEGILNTLKQYCNDEIESYYNDGGALKAEINHSGECEIVLLNDVSNEPIRCWVIKDVFYTEKVYG